MGMLGMGGATERLACELRRLREAAGNPSYSRLVDEAKQHRPPVKLAPATLTGWFRGQTVPSDSGAWRYLIGNLQSRAQRRGCASACKDWREWERLRQAAVKERGVVLPPPTPPDGVPNNKARFPALDAARIKWWILAAVAASSFALGFTTARLTSLPAPRPTVTKEIQGAPPDADPPVIVGTDGKVRKADPLPGPSRWFVAQDVRGPGACLDGWACLFQNQNYNTEASGWMILVQDEDKTYNFEGQYDKAVRSWMNRTPVEIAWHQQPNDEGSWHGMEPGARKPSLGTADQTMSSLHTMTDADAWPPGSHP
jgi:Peptidase inhibitor family I36